MKLSTEQRTAVNARAPRLGILAGAGAGKTTVLLARALSQIEEGIDPATMLICTFTEATAAELLARFRWETPHLTTEPPVITTLHGWAYAELRRVPELFGLTESFSVYDKADAEYVSRSVRAQLGTKGSSEAAQQLYRDRLVRANAVDYDGLLRAASEILWRGDRTRFPDAPPEWAAACDAMRARCRHVLVDEAQDLDPLQWAILSAMHAETLTAVGDPRQAIYQFRGARSEHFEAFLQAADRVVPLADNYRSSSPIVALANEIAGPSAAPMVVARASLGEARIGADPIDLAELVRSANGSAGRRYSDVAVLGRTWSTLRRARELLELEGIPVAWGGAVIDRWERPHSMGRVVSAWLRLQRNPSDDNLAMQVADAVAPPLNRTWRREIARQEGTTVYASLRKAGILPDLGDPAYVVRKMSSANALQALIDWMNRSETAHIATKLADYLEPLRHRQRHTLRGFWHWWTFGRTPDRNDDGEEDAVTVTTVHGAKGREWPVVIGIDCSADQFRRGDEDRNCLYVLCTRARDRLVLCIGDGDTPTSHLPRPYEPVALPNDGPW